MATNLKGVGKQYVGTTEQLAGKTVTSLDSLNMTDFPETAITNQQMADAISTYSQLYRVGEIYVCSDDGVYIKGTMYQFTRANDIFSWTAITAPTISEYIKAASISGNTLTLINQDDIATVFTPTAGASITWREW